jgi:GT2 family glycosyltransferase
MAPSRKSHPAVDASSVDNKGLGQRLRLMVRHLKAIARPLLCLPANWRTRRACRQIAVSGLFDAYWYASQHPEALSSRADPLRHFVTIGWRRAFDPSPLFDISWYTSAYPEAKRRDVNPLLHYLQVGSRRHFWPNPFFNPDWYLQQLSGPIATTPLGHYLGVGAALGLTPHPDFDASAYCQRVPEAASGGLTPLGHFLTHGGRDLRLAKASPTSSTQTEHCPVAHAPANPYRWWRMPICVLVPVYNAPAEVARCLDALLAHTPESVSILLIDDASTELEVASCLAAAARDPRVTLMRNATNQGFTRTVNRGLALVRDRDVVVLNSDTKVTPRWLTYLAAAAYERDDIGTATATSNSAGQFSVPLRFHNTIPYWLEPDDYARAIAQSHRTLALAAPFGHGFCLYLKRRYIDAVGLLDDEAFPRGYGEEIDLCLRGAHAGWHHVLATKSFVYHVKAASFGATKTELKPRPREVLDRRYPEFSSLLRLFRRDPALLAYRKQVAKLWQRLDPAEPRRLVVVSSDPALAPQNQRALDVDMDRAVLVLAACGRDLRLYRLKNDAPEVVGHARIASAPDPFSPFGDGYDDVIGRWLLEYAIEAVEIRGLHGHGANLARLAADLEIPVTLLLDDAYPVCPVSNLTDERGRACGGRCTPSKGDCLSRPDPEGRRLKHDYVTAWQAAYRESLAYVNTITVLSDSLRTQLTKVFSELADRHIPVIDQDTLLTRQSRPSPALRSVGSSVRIGLYCPMPQGLGDRALHNRILAPLTHPMLRERLSVEVVPINTFEAADLGVDLTIVPLTEFLTATDAAQLLENLTRAHVPLVVDLGCSGYRRADLLQRHTAGDQLRSLLDAATELWTTEDWNVRLLSEFERKCAQIPTGIDTRIWPRNRARHRVDAGDPLRLLYRAKGNDCGTLDVAMDTVDRLRGRIDRTVELLLVTESAPAVKKRPWLRVLKVPDMAMSSYPIFAAWLAQQGPFDFALMSLLEVSDACPLTTILEHAALGAISIAGNPHQHISPTDDLGPTRLVAPSPTACADAIETALRASADAAAADEKALTQLLAARGGSAAARVVATRLALQL